MSFLDRLRNMLAGPPHISDSGDPEVDADLHEEYGAADAGEADVKRFAETGGGTGSFGAAESGEAAEADLESEETPPDPNP